MSNPKIICPAPSKTGTVSLSHALDLLGYRIAHYPHGPEITSALISGHAPIKLLYRYDGITDLPASIWWRELLEQYDGSVIIMTFRGTTEWLDSMIAHYQKNPPKQDIFDIHDLLRVRFYGFSGINRSKWESRLFTLFGELVQVQTTKKHPALWLDLRNNNEDLLRRLVSFLQEHLSLSDEMIAEASRNGLSEFPRLNKTRRQ